MEHGDENDKELEEIRRKKLESMMKGSDQGAKQKSDVTRARKAVILNEANFWEIVQKTARVLIDCYADWCGPCKMLEPIFEQLAVVHQTILFGRINVDNAPNISSQFQIKGIPLMLFFKNGQLVNKLLGAQSSETIEAQIKRFLG
jgi:thioredoxin 1